MSGDPKRWLDDAHDAPPGARELLAQARRTPKADKRALALSAAALLELGTQPTTAAAAVLAKLTSAGASVAGLPLAGKLAVATATIALATTVAVVQVAPRSERPSAVRTAQTAVPAARDAAAQHSHPTVPAPAVPVPAVEPEAAPEIEPGPALEAVTTAAPRRARTQARARVKEPVVAPAAVATPNAPQPEPAPDDGDQLALEVRWLDQARALLAGDPAAALARADAHARRFANGALAAERELIAVDALQRLGRAPEARRRADVLLARNPGSLYRGRLHELLRAP